MASGSVPKTRKQLTSRLTDFVGKGKEFEQSEVPTVRAVVQRGIVMRNRLIIQQEALKFVYMTTKCMVTTPCKVRRGSFYSLTKKLYVFVYVG